MSLKINHLFFTGSFIILEVLSCKPANNNDTGLIDSVAINIPEDINRPPNVDTTIPVTHFAEYLEYKYTLDPVQQQDISDKFEVEEKDSLDRIIKTSSIRLKDLSIDYKYTYFRKLDSSSTEIKINGVERTFVDEEGKPALEFGDLTLDRGLSVYTIAGEKYVLISCSPVNAVGWFDTSTYGMLAKIADSNSVMLLSTYAYPDDPYLTGDFYIRQNRYNGKVFTLIAGLANFDDNGNPENIYLTIKELHL